MAARQVGHDLGRIAGEGLLGTADREQAVVDGDRAELGMGQRFEHDRDVLGCRGLPVHGQCIAGRHHWPATAPTGPT
jgi:hypothetical protein